MSSSVLPKEPPEPIDPLAQANLENFFNCRLRQFNLDGHYHTHDIFNEAFLRLQKALQSGQHIRNTEAWLRITGFHYVQELSRFHKKCNSVEPHVFELYPIDEESSEEQDPTESKLVSEVFNQMKAGDRELLVLRIFEELTWEEIQQQLANKGKSIRIDALRQRGKRAQDRLREAFLEKLDLIDDTLNNSGFT